MKCRQCHVGALQRLRRRAEGSRLAGGIALVVVGILILIAAGLYVAAAVVRGAPASEPGSMINAAVGAVVATHLIWIGRKMTVTEFSRCDACSRELPVDQFSIKTSWPPGF